MITQKIKKLEKECNVKPGTLESALIFAACSLAAPILILIAIILN